MNVGNSLTLEQALNITRELLPDGTAKPFDLQFVTCSESRKVGGEIKNVINVTRSGLARDSWKTGELGFYDSVTGEHRACHIDLILRINSQNVAL